ncbi:hypothetical protein [Thermosipho sp. (in: thermotogales)]|jgi:hypothetical protein|nr:hypothetical protein [Thermosipho sp. (in: thermotogales)]MBZ4649214.1 hypothetical protein [Thermosipho sp. (in: thermotogales)]
MKRITWWNIIGQQTMIGTDEEILKKAEELDSCDILYNISIINEKEEKR